MINNNLINGNLMTYREKVDAEIFLFFSVSASTIYNIIKDRFIFIFS